MSRKNFVGEKFPVVVPNPAYPFVQVYFATWLALTAAYCDRSKILKIPEIGARVLSFLPANEFRKVTLLARILLAFRENFYDIYPTHIANGLTGLFNQYFQFEKKLRWNCFASDSANRNLHFIENDSNHLISSAQFSPDGKWLVTYSYFYNIKIWSVETGQCVKTFKNKVFDLCSVAMNEASELLVLYGFHNHKNKNYIYQLLNANTGKCIRQSEFNKSVELLRMSPDGKRILSIERGATSSAFNITLRSEDTIEKWTLSRSSTGTPHFFSNRYLTNIYITGYLSKQCEVMDLIHKSASGIIFDEGYNIFDISPDEKNILCRSENAKEIKIFNIERNAVIHSFEIQGWNARKYQEAFFVDSGTKVALVHMSGWVWASSYNYELSLYSVQTGELLSKKRLYGMPDNFAVHNEQFLLCSPYYHASISIFSTRQKFVCDNTSDDTKAARF